MKKVSILLVIVVLLLASLACQTIMGGGGSNSSSNNSGGSNPTQDSGGGNNPTGSSTYPMPDDASNVMSIAGTTNFQTKLSLDDAMNFYRDQLGKTGYTERTALTVTSSSTFSMVFDGDASGKAMVIQGVDLGNGLTNIAISLQGV